LPSQTKAFFIVQSTRDNTAYSNWSCDIREEVKKETLLFCQRN
jgi:hypothetical protein